MVGNRVDRKIPAREVVSQGDAKFHYGMTTVGPNVLAEGRYLMETILRVDHRDGPVLNPDRNGARKQAADLLGKGGGRQVEIMVLEIQQIVPNCAADAPRLVTRRLEFPGDVQDFRWNREPLGEPSITLDRPGVRQIASSRSTSATMTCSTARCIS